MDLKEYFLNSADFENLKRTSNLEELTLKLIALFKHAGFKFYPEWRGIHKSGQFRKNFTFKVRQSADSRNQNLITVYPMSGWLKVEIYRGQYDKKHYPVNVNNIGDHVEMEPLLNDAISIYNSISTLKL